ncbi:MAG: hypothetical protein J0M18_14830 [Ignavibacteria bacterium]|nr:hypothetical protein [Ignavibacteria bacterium]
MIDNESFLQVLIKSCQNFITEREEDKRKFLVYLDSFKERNDAVAVNTRNNTNKLIELIDKEIEERKKYIGEFESLEN